MRARPCLTLAAALAACGYTAGVRLPEGVRRVAVPIFGNETFRRGLEFDLTAAVARAVLDRTDVEVTTVPQAQALLRGRIVSATTPTLVEGNPDELLEASVLLTVEAELVEARSGRPLARLRLTDRAEIASVRGETRTDAFRESIDTIAERIVLGLAERGRVGEPDGSGGGAPTSSPRR